MSIKEFEQKTSIDIYKAEMTDVYFCLNGRIIEEKEANELYEKASHRGTTAQFILELIEKNKKEYVLVTKGTLFVEDELKYITRISVFDKNTDIFIIAHILC